MIIKTSMNIIHEFYNSHDTVAATWYMLNKTDNRHAQILQIKINPYLRDICLFISILILGLLLDIINNFASSLPCQLFSFLASKIINNQQKNTIESRCDIF